MTANTLQDYKLRAQDHNRKKAKLKALREKAADRNEDEFYFGMLSRPGMQSRVQDGKRWKGTVQGDRGNRAMDVDVVRMLKTQDIGYVRTMRSVVRKEVERLREQVVFAADGMEEDDEDDDEFDFGKAPARPRKIVFVQEGDATPADEEMEDDDDDDEEEFQGLDDEDKTDDAAEAEAQRKAKNLKRLRAELTAAEAKLKALREVEAELEVQQAKMAKTATSGGTTKKGKKIMVRTRKR